MMQKYKKEFERAFLMLVCIFLLAAIGATTLSLHRYLCRRTSGSSAYTQEAQVLPSVRFKTD